MAHGWVWIGLALALVASSIGMVALRSDAPTKEEPLARSLTPSTQTPSQAAPGAAPGLGDQAHVHDYWEGASSVVLINQAVVVMVAHNHQFDEPPREQHTHGCDETLVSTSQGGSVKFGLPSGKIVLPGTERLEFLMDWSDASVTGLRLKYRPVGMHDYLDGGLVEKGKVMRLPLTLQMADAGHATRSAWGFFLCAAGPSPVNFAEGAIQVNLMAMRGETLPLDPAHPDLWAGATHLTLANVTFTPSGVTVLNKGDAAWLHVPLPRGTIVPGGTTRIVTHIHAEDATPTASLRPADYLLYYQDSTVPDWIYRIANRTSETGMLAFELPVAHDMVDGVYARESNWDFWVRIAAPERVQTTAGLESAPQAFQGTIHVKVEAIRDEPAGTTTS
ncbi:MAG: hypothetical protein WDA16_06635 [Candidatus Thermoplasmatota archaeon]